MALSGPQLAAAFLGLLAVILVIGLLARGGRPELPMRQREDDVPPIADPTGPYEVPEDDAPSRSDD